MIEKTIAFAGAVCVLAILIVPSADDKAQEAASSNEAASASPFSGSSNKTFAANSNSSGFSGEHILNREADGHFYASASVDGAHMRMLVDTGASVIALTGDDARAAGVFWDDNEIRNIGQGASGAVYGVPVTLNDVEIGGMVRRNVQAVVIPQGLSISLLGQSYLSQIGSVEIADDRMTLTAD
ncbi:MAG: TIGR02281 family clan AA aspartic protease [Pseudomonadota bacterium]